MHKGLSMEGKWLSVLEFASYKGKSISTVRRYIKANRVKHKDVQGKYYIWVKNYKSDINDEERELFELKLENQRLKKENRVLMEELAEVKMLINLYEQKDKELPPEIPQL